MSSDIEALLKSVPAFDSLWNYNDPAETEAKFRQLLPTLQASGDVQYVAELLTQLARSQGLQQKFDDALATLKDAEALITEDMKVARVRSLLEHGRVLNSSGNRAGATPLFTDALQRAQEFGLEFYAIDAAHMLGIVTAGEESLRWNEEAIRLAEAAVSPRARRWLGSLYNNTGWTYFDMGRYSDALALFEKDVEFFDQANRKPEAGIARWSAAKMLRHMGRVEESLVRQMALLDWPERQDGDAGGYTQEEIGECLLLLGREADAAPHFARAWELLHTDPWLLRDEPQRLERLKRLGHIPGSAS